MIKINRRLRTGVNIKTEHCSSSTRPPEHMVVGMKGNKWQRIQCISDRACATDVIKMSMGVPQMGNAPSALLRCFENDMTIPGGIDDGRIMGFRICHEIRVGLGRTQSE